MSLTECSHVAQLRASEARGSLLVTVFPLVRISQTQHGNDAVQGVCCKRARGTCVACGSDLVIFLTFFTSSIIITGSNCKSFVMDS